MKDKFNLLGFLELRGYQKGHLIWIKRGKNLIVTAGRQGLLECLAGTSNKNIAKVQAGTNATTTSLSDIAITNPVDITGLTFSSTAAALIISFDFGENMGTGMLVSEFGIILKDGTLFSRKTVTAFEKIAGLSVKGTWTINLS